MLILICNFYVTVVDMVACVVNEESRFLIVISPRIKIIGILTHASPLVK